MTDEGPDSSLRGVGNEYGPRSIPQQKGPAMSTTTHTRGSSFTRRIVAVAACRSTSSSDQPEKAVTPVSVGISSSPSADVGVAKFAT
jgi:hypothetical protein